MSAHLGKYHNNTYISGVVHHAQCMYIAIFTEFSLALIHHRFLLKPVNVNGLDRRGAIMVVAVDVIVMIVISREDRETTELKLNIIISKAHQRYLSRLPFSLRLSYMYVIFK